MRVQYGPGTVCVCVETGALGNMVRNSDLLDAELALNKAPQALVAMLMRDPSAAGANVALFSLGLHAVYHARWVYIVCALRQRLSCAVQ